MDDRVADSLEGDRFNLLLVACLALTAVILVAVGLFGTVSYFVQQRTQEFGVRVALGASRFRILQHAIGQALRSGIAGLALGLGASLGLGRLLRHALYLSPHEHEGMLYAVSIYDPTTLTLACALLLVVILAASYFPARRAAKVDPLIALRYE
jgi:putative ABC transport system permease protein